MEYGSEKYYKKLNGKKVICIDFDNTVCLDEWPYIGPLIPGAIEVLRKLQKAGHRLILYTQRTTSYPICCKELQEMIDKDPSLKGYRSINRNQEISTIDILSDAIKVFEDNHIELEDINMNLSWEGKTHDNARKIFMDYLIDDHVIGTDRLEVTNKFGEVCKIVDWFKIDRWCMKEELYKDSAFKCSYYEYLKQIENLNS